MLDQTQIYKKKNGVPWQTIAETTIALSPGDQMTYEFEGVASFIWQSLDGNQCNEKIISNLCEVYEIDQKTAEYDYYEFLNELSENNLLE